LRPSTTAENYGFLALSQFTTTVIKTGQSGNLEKRVYLWRIDSRELEWAMTTRPPFSTLTTCCILLLIAITSAFVGSLEAQTPDANPPLIEQHFYAGGSVGLFDGYTTSASYGAHFGWIGPTKSIPPIGGMSPEVAFAVQYIPKVHLERLRYIPDAIARDGVSASAVVGPRFGGQLGFRTLFGLALAGAKAPLTRCQGLPSEAADWVLLAQADNGKSSASPTSLNVPTADSRCGKSNGRFPFTAEIGPDLQLQKFRITLPMVITQFGDHHTRTQYSFRLGVDFSFGRN
jgi:hypothetical protein